MPSRHNQLVEVEAVEPTAVVSAGGVPPPPGCGADLDVMDVMAAKALIMTHSQEKHDVGDSCCAILCDGDGPLHSPRVASPRKRLQLCDLLVAVALAAVLAAYVGFQAVGLVAWLESGKRGRRW